VHEINDIVKRRGARKQNTAAPCYNRTWKSKRIVRSRNYRWPGCPLDGLEIRRFELRNSTLASRDCDSISPTARHPRHALASDIVARKVASRQCARLSNVRRISGAARAPYLRDRFCCIVARKYNIYTHTHTRARARARVCVCVCVCI